MLQANALLVVEGNAEHSGFARMDVLRFALGVLILEDESSVEAEELRRVLNTHDCEVSFVSSRTRQDAQQLLVFDVRWKTGLSANTEVIHRELRRHFKVERFALSEHPIEP